MADPRLPNSLVRTALFGLLLSACFDRPPEPGFADGPTSEEEDSKNNSDSTADEDEGSSIVPGDDENGDERSGNVSDQNDSGHDGDDSSTTASDASTGSTDTLSGDNQGETAAEAGQDTETTGDDDLDEGGQEAASETEDSKVFCDGHWQGERLWVRSATELAALEGCTHVEGHLHILGCKAEVDPGAGDNPNCDPRDPILSLAQLSSLRHIEGDLWVEGVESVTSLAGLEGVASLQSMTIRNNPDLTAVSGFDALVGEAVTIEIISNPELLSVTGFNGLTRLRDGLEISSNPRLELLDGFDGVTRIEHLIISNVQKLAWIEAFARLKEATNLVVRLAEDLPRLRIARLEKVGAIAKISECKSLETLELPKLNEVANLDITDLRSLTSVDMQALEEADLLTLSGNGMPDLNGFSELKFVREHLKIVNNTGFSDAYARHFASDIDVGGSIVIQNNGL